MQNVPLRDIMLKIVRLCPTFTLYEILGDQDDFDSLTDGSVNQEVLHWFDTSLVENAYTRKITILSWPKNCSISVHMSPSVSIQRETLEKEIKSLHSGELMVRPVELGIQDMRWFHHDRKNFIAFSRLLQGLPSSVYSS